MMTPRRVVRGSGLLLLLVGLGCSERGVQPSAPPAASPAPAAPAPVAAVPAPAAKRVGPAIKALRGELARGGPLAEGQLLEPDLALTLKPKAVLTLDFARGTRLVVHGPAEIVAAPRGEQAVLLGRGIVELELPPSAPGPDSGFLAATPSLHLGVVRGAHLVVRVFDDGSSEAAVLAGSVAAVARDAAAIGALRAGQGVRTSLDGPAEIAQLGASTVDAARERLQRLPAREGDAQRLRGALDAELAALADEVAAEVARQEQLVAAHRERIGKPEALAAQAEVATQAGKLARARARLRALLGRRGALRQEAAPAADDALGQRAEQLVAR